jgi:hypothetical protein
MLRKVLTLLSTAAQATLLTRCLNRTRSRLLRFLGCGGFPMDWGRNNFTSIHQPPGDGGNAGNGKRYTDDRTPASTRDRNSAANSLLSADDH